MFRTAHALAFLSIPLILGFFVHIAYAQSGGSRFVPNDDLVPLSDLEMLSIVAASREGPANVANPEEDTAQREREPLRVQNTFNAQDMIVGAQLHAAENPERVADEGLIVAASDEGAVAPVVELVEEGAFGTESHDDTAAVIPGPASLEVVIEDIIADTIVKPDVIALVPVIVPVSVEELAQVAREPSSGPSFSYTGRSIPTMQRLYSSDGQVIDEMEMTEPPVLATAEDGSTVLTGACLDAYFVVLLYKEAEDFERDTDSYILNRAYPCTGAYRYSLDSVPRSLPNGTYHLLIGEQGEVGDWIPATALTEISIHRD